MPGPSGIFVGLTLEELEAQKAIALNRIAYGDRVAMAGAGKSSTKNFSMSAQQHLLEVNYAIGKLSGTNPPRSTHFDASKQSPRGNA